jgi:hypothetical protein
VEQTCRGKCQRLALLAEVAIVTTQTLETARLLEHLRGERAEFVLRRGAAGPDWQDEAVHAAAYAADPGLYALCGLAEGVQPGQRARVLFQVLRASRAGRTQDVRRTLERAGAVLLRGLPADDVLQVFLALRRVRANHKHTSRAIAGYLLDHPALELLALRRRPAVVDSLEHALGKNVARACARRLREAGTEDAMVRRHLGRHARQPERLAAALGYLYGAAAPPVQAGTEAAEALAGAPLDRRDAEEAPRTVTATNRGDIAATLYHLYRGGESAELRSALDGYVARAAERLPRFGGKLAVVLDASASTRGYGDREWCCIAQSVALRLVLERCSAQFAVYPCGGAGEPPVPEGATDLAGPLLDALDGAPDVVAIVTDGYENQTGGDLERVAAALPSAGVTAAVVLCHSKFTARDDLSLRHAAPSLPELEFWHENDFAEVAFALYARAPGGKGTAFVRDHLMGRLERLEAETASWTCSTPSPGRS